MTPFVVMTLMILGQAEEASPDLDALRSDRNSYFMRTVSAVEACARDVPAMQKAAEDAAERLAAGGNLYAAGNLATVNELTARAGGMMMVQKLAENEAGPEDVVLFSETRDASLPPEIDDSEALVIVFTAGETKGDAGDARFSSHANENNLPPVLANSIPAWLFTAELVSALTREGKMPTMFETVGLPTGFSRLNNLYNQKVWFHEGPPPSVVPPGDLATQYSDALVKMLKRLHREEGPDLERVAEWCATAVHDGNRLFMYTMGHMFPEVVLEEEIEERFETHVYYAGFTRAIPEEFYGTGDVVIHIGYQQPPLPIIEKALDADARVAYASVHAHRDYIDMQDVVWIDPMWPYDDAVVEVKGYDIPVLPPSGVINGALAWEIYRLTEARIAEMEEPEQPLSERGE